MEVIHPRCCGIDVHKESMVACLRLHQGRRAKGEVRRFGTTTAELLRLHEWLSQAGCTHVAMESTSAYWKPVFNLLEGSFEVVLANAYHIKTVPGRKTDVKDCEWIADLLAHGLIRASFVPPRQSVTCAISRAIVRASSGIGSRPLTVCISCWKRPTSSWRT